MGLGPELIINGGMEIGDPPTGWTIAGPTTTAERSNTHAHTGTYSFRTVEATNNYNGFYQNIPITTGKKYRIAFWYWIESGEILAENTGGLLWFVGLTIKGSWQYYEVDIIATNSNPSPLQFYSNGMPSEFFIDDVSAKEIKQTRQYLPIVGIG